MSDHQQNSNQDWQQQQLQPQAPPPPPQPQSQFNPAAFDECLKLIQSTQTEAKMAGLALACKLLPNPAPEEAILQLWLVLSEGKTSFLVRMLTSKNSAWQSLGVNICSVLVSNLATADNNTTTTNTNTHNNTIISHPVWTCHVLPAIVSLLTNSLTSDVNANSTTETINNDATTNDTNKTHTNDTSTTALYVTSAAALNVVLECLMQSKHSLALYTHMQEPTSPDNTPGLHCISHVWHGLQTVYDHASRVCDDETKQRVSQAIAYTLTHTEHTLPFATPSQQTTQTTQPATITEQQLCINVNDINTTNTTDSKEVVEVAQAIAFCLRVMCDVLASPSQTSTPATTTENANTNTNTNTNMVSEASRMGHVTHITTPLSAILAIVSLPMQRVRHEVVAMSRDGSGGWADILQTKICQILRHKITASVTQVCLAICCWVLDVRGVGWLCHTQDGMFELFVRLLVIELHLAADALTPLQPNTPNSLVPQPQPQPQPQHHHHHQHQVSSHDPLLNDHHRQGNEAMARQEYTLAAQSYSQAMACAPASALLHSNRSLALLHLKRHDEALADADKALQLCKAQASTLSPTPQAISQLSRAHQRRGQALHALCQYGAAIESFTLALALAPDRTFLNDCIAQAKADMNKATQWISHPNNDDDDAGGDDDGDAGGESGAVNSRINLEKSHPDILSHSLMRSRQLDPPGVLGVCVMGVRVCILAVLTPTTSDGTLDTPSAMSAQQQLATALAVRPVPIRLVDLIMTHSMETFAKKHLELFWNVLQLLSIFFAEDSEIPIEPHEFERLLQFIELVQEYSEGMVVGWVPALATMTSSPEISNVLLENAHVLRNIIKHMASYITCFDHIGMSNDVWDVGVACVLNCIVNTASFEDHTPHFISDLRNLAQSLSTDASTKDHRCNWGVLAIVFAVRVRDANTTHSLPLPPHTLHFVCSRLPRHDILESVMGGDVVSLVCNGLADEITQSKITVSDADSLRLAHSCTSCLLTHIATFIHHTHGSSNTQQTTTTNEDDENEIVQLLHAIEHLMCTLLLINHNGNHGGGCGDVLTSTAMKKAAKKLKMESLLAVIANQR